MASFQNQIPPIQTISTTDYNDYKQLQVIASSQLRWAAFRARIQGVRAAGANRSSSDGESTLCCFKQATQDPPPYRQTKSIWALCAGATRMAHWELSRVEAGSSAWLAPATCHILWEELGLRIGTRNCQGVQCPGSEQPTRHGTKNTRFACAPNIARSIELFVKERTKPIRAIFSRKERGPPFIQSVSQLGCMWKDAVEPCKQGVRIQDRVVDCRWSKSIYTPLLLVSISVVLRFGSGSQQLQLSDVAWTMM